jgi:hypothetical protein
VGTGVVQKTAKAGSASLSLGILSEPEEQGSASSGRSKRPEQGYQPAICSDTRFWFASIFSRSEIT